MEAAPGVTDCGVCAGVVNNLRSTISVTEPPCCKDGGHNNKETKPEEDLIIRHNDSDFVSARKKQPDDVVSSRQDMAHYRCQEQVNEILHIKNGGNKTWRLYNPFNLWRDKSYNATAKTENAVDVVSCEFSGSCQHVLDVVCTDNTNIESAFFKYRVLPSNNASNISKQNIYPSECNINVSDCKRNIDIRPFEGTSQHEEQLSTSTNGFRSFVFGPITNLFLSSFRRIYPCASPVVSSNWDSEDMGNLQGSESKSKGGGGSSKSPAKGKKDKSGKKSPAKELLKHKAPAPPPPSKSNSGTSGAQQKVVPPQGNVPTAGSHASHNGTAAPNQSALPSSETTTYVVTDSWRHVKKLAIKTPAPNNTTLLTPPSRDSSSESVFTDPLTPQGFAETQNHSSYYSDTCSTEQANEPAELSAYFQTLPVDGTDHDSVFTSLKSDVGMVRSDGGSDKDRNGGCTSLSTTDLDDVTLTLVDSTEQLTDGEDMGGCDFVTTVQKRPQSHSLDALDEEDTVEDSDKKTKSLDALEVTAGVGVTPHTRTTQPPSSFTVVKHRKVELNPTRLSEHCLLPSGKHIQKFCRNTKNKRILQIWNYYRNEYKFVEGEYTMNSCVCVCVCVCVHVFYL